MVYAARPDTAHRLPLRLRLKAWWDGCDLILRQAQPEAPPVEAPRRAVIGYRDPERPWETPRVKLAQLLWGEGFSHPGGTEEAIRLAKPFALNPAMTVLDLSAGLGGGARALVEEFGVWVTGLDRDAEFAEAGMQMSTLAGVGRKAEIGQFDPARFELRAASVDCITWRELLHGVADKARLLHAIAVGLKPRGQLLLTDYMLAEGRDPQSAAIREWLAVEPDSVQLWSPDEFTRCLVEQGLEVRVTEDITAAVRRMALSAWARLAAGIAGASLTSEMKDCMVAELERWMRRIAAFDAGDLVVYRIYALQGASTRMLSDW